MKNFDEKKNLNRKGNAFRLLYVANNIDSIV
jgi:hypothetical protein